MSKKPRNKKYNHRKLDQWAARVATQGTMLIQAQGLGKDGKIWIFHDKPVPQNQWLTGSRMTDYRLIFLTPHKWTILAGVACRDQLGENYFRYAQQSSNNELIYHDPQIQQWINVFDPENIKTHYEMQQIKAKAESEIKGLALEDYLPKQTACTGTT